MIEKLEHEDFQINGFSDARFVMLINKINELVEAVNRMEKQIEKLQVL